MGAAGMIAEPPRKPDQLQTSLSTAAAGCGRRKAAFFTPSGVLVTVSGKRK